MATVQFQRNLRLDSPLLRGNDVLALQSALKVSDDQRDGIFGKGTERAVIDYQRRNRLTADGVVGSRTWTQLLGGAASATDQQPSEGTRGPERYSDELKQFHNRYADSVRWRLTADGVEIDGQGVEATTGQPETVRRVCHDYQKELQNAASVTGVPVELLVATMCTEAFDRAMRTVNPRATRREPGYISDAATPHRVSYGLTQTLLSTARQAISQLPGSSSVPAQAIDREWLFQPGNAILAGAAYIKSQSLKTHFDPPVAACAYNAGNVFHNSGIKNRWKMRQFPIGTDAHANRFVQWFNDCFRLFKSEGCPFAVGTTFWHLCNPGSPTVIGIRGRAEPQFSGSIEASPDSHASPMRVPGHSEFIFPQRTRPAQDYKSGAREFGARRSGGKRKHAGCDLKAPKGTEILAMADGKVIRGPYSFYSGTFALEVQHANGMVVRYGEIDAKVPKGIQVGASVKQGQVIAFVGRLESGNSMLHLEMYRGDKSGPLSQNNSPPFMRRSDLVDPTPYLDQAPVFDAAGAIPAEVVEAEMADSRETAEPEGENRWLAALKKAPTTGASAATAAQDHLTPGVEASQHLAKADLERVKKLAVRFQSAAAKFELPGALLAAIASRESHCGAALKDGWGDRGNAFGILQIDRRSHDLDGLPDPESEAHIEEAAAIVNENLQRVAELHPDWEDEFILKGAAVAYNAGTINVRTKEKMDIGTTGNDYAADVIARAQYYMGQNILNNS